MPKIRFAQTTVLLGIAAVASVAAAITLAALFFYGSGQRPAGPVLEVDAKAYGEMTADVKAMLINLSANGYGCTLMAIRYAHMQKHISDGQRESLANLIRARDDECRKAVQIDILHPKRVDPAKAKDTKNANKAPKH